METGINDSSFVVITGPPQKDKHKRISQVRSVIRKSQLRRDGHLQPRKELQVSRARAQILNKRKLLDAPERQLATLKLDLSWLSVSEAVGNRLKYFFHQYIESSAHLHPFFHSQIPLTILHAPLMSTKLVHATAWDDLSGPNPEISNLTLLQRDIADNMLLDSILEATGPTTDAESSHVALIALLSMLSFEMINGDRIAYKRHKTNINRLLDMRGGLDGLEESFRITLLAIYQLESVIKGFADSTTPSYLRYTTENGSQIISQPSDFKLMTFHRGQTRLWEGQNEISQRRQLIRIQWQFLCDNLIALASIPFRVDTGPPIDQILLYAILLFVTSSLPTYHPVIEGYINKLQPLLQKSNVLELYHGPLPGALIWCLIIGARKSHFPQESGVGGIQKWFFMQLMRIACPAALDNPLDVARNIDLILAGMEGVEYLATGPYDSS
ncbi:hypothetical protein TSTA_073270 [Talaromyces stipitatus ATCC 10500]|uniref:Uncharacterized protein n=1 Tax=Talaromyces stipitatus (strain ATCC 10500 / CBS 375.48 / QM 6759 / NRRL 1006) TaxID=441959 RepID=B8LUT0_TALSN|nr:uncharacterized protein TSTA_073270 [Talaromyces stipitatus ATCC 10500]EED23937.1 hypothetical protein TSTA_073270 [Talaromyces stipitatus ATCC 10500]